MIPVTSKAISNIEKPVAIGMYLPHDLFLSFQTVVRLMMYLFVYLQDPNGHSMVQCSSPIRINSTALNVDEQVVAAGSVVRSETGCGFAVVGS